MNVSHRQVHRVVPHWSNYASVTVMTADAARPVCCRRQQQSIFNLMLPSILAATQARPAISHEPGTSVCNSPLASDSTHGTGGIASGAAVHAANLALIYQSTRHRGF